MPAYLYSCPVGHVTERVFVSHTQRTTTTRCDARECDRRARYHFGLTTRAIQVIPDLNAHFNVSIDQHVRSRRHLRDLQKRHGFVDYDRTQQPSSDWHDRHQRSLESARRPAEVGERRAQERIARGEEA